MSAHPMPEPGIIRALSHMADLSSDFLDGFNQTVDQGPRNGGDTPSLQLKLYMFPTLGTVMCIPVPCMFYLLCEFWITFVEELERVENGAFARRPFMWVCEV